VVVKIETKVEKNAGSTWSIHYYV